MGTFFLLFLPKLEKNACLRAAFSSSCGGLQSSAAPVRLFGPNNGALRAQPKMLKIYLKTFAEINLNFFAKICLKFFSEIRLNNFAEIHLKFFAEIYLDNFAEIHLTFFADIRLEIFVEICLEIFAEIHLENFAEINFIFLRKSV